MNELAVVNGQGMTTTGLTAGQWLLALKAYYEQRERLAKLERDRVAFLCDMFKRGKHRVYMSPHDGWVREIKTTGGKGAIYHPENYFGALADSAVTEIVRAQPQFEIRAGKDSGQAAEAARAVGAFVQYQQRQIFTESVKQDIGYRTMLHGTLAAYGFWNQKIGETKTVPKIDLSVTKEPDAYMCHNCGQQGMADEMMPASDVYEEGIEGDACPACSSLNVSVEEGAMIPRPVVTGESAYKLGDVDVQWIPIYEMNANAEARQTRQRGRTHFNNLHWFQWVVHLDRSVAKAAHPNYTGSWHMASDGMADDTRGKRYQERLQRTSGGTENDRMGYSDGAGMRLIKYDRDFFNEDVLSEFVAGTRHQLIENDPTSPWIEKGQSLADVFPSGVKMTSTGRQVVALEEESVTKHVRFFKWKQDPESFWGIPAIDAVPLQILLNEQNSLITTNLMANETPRLLYNKLAIKKPELFSNPTAAIPFDVLPGDLGAEQIIKVIPALALGQYAYIRPQDIRQSMQRVFGAAFFGESGEAGSENMRTAAAWSIANDRAMAKAFTIMALLAESQAGLLEMLVDIFNENADEARWIAIQGDFAEVEYLALSRSDMARDFEITVKKGSSVPRAEYQLRDDWKQYYEWETNWIATRGSQPNPAIVLQASQRYGVEIAGQEAVKAARVARMRLEALKEVAPMAPQIAQMYVGQQMEQMSMAAQSAGVDPQMLAVQAMQTQQMLSNPAGIAQLTLAFLAENPGSPASVRKQGDYHEPMYLWFQNWLNTDEGINADPVLAELVQGTMLAHEAAAFEVAAQRQARQAMSQMTAMAPVQQAAMASGLGGDGDDPTKDVEDDKTAAANAAPPSHREDRGD